MSVSLSASPSDRPSAVNLAIETGGIAFRNPVLTASGTFGYGMEFEGLTDLETEMVHDVLVRDSLDVGTKRCVALEETVE